MYTRIIAVSVALASLSLAGVQAQTLGQNPVPAEFPPSSFTGNQYVDSQGCVFIRAGVDGNVTWVPRVSRNRRQVCGATPSLSGAQAQTQTAAPAAPQVEQIVPRATATPAPAPAPAPRVAAPRAPVAAPSPGPEPTLFQNPPPRQAAPAPAPTVTPRRTQPVATVAAPRPRVATPSPGPEPTLFQNPAPRQAAPAPTTTVAPVRTQQGGGCANASAFSQQYINSGARFPVRCGPQAESPVTRPAGSGAAGSGGGVRILPTHLVESRTAMRQVRVPDGFEPVWTDDRLNPRRGEQSVQGYIQSQSTVNLRVPRQPVGGSGPKRIKEPRIVSDTPIRTSRVQFVYGAAAGAAKAERAPQVPSGKIFVQVGAFGDAAQAQVGAQRMARTGIPTRMGKKVRGNTAVQLVLAGPFASRSEADAAVRAARRAGFANAVVMN